MGIIDIFENVRKTNSDRKSVKSDKRDYSIKKDKDGNDEFTGTKKGDMKKKESREAR